MMEMISEKIDLDIWIKSYIICRDMHLERFIDLFREGMLSSLDGHRWIIKDHIREKQIILRY